MWLNQNCTRDKRKQKNGINLEKKVGYSSSVSSYLLSKALSPKYFVQNWQEFVDKNIDIQYKVTFLGKGYGTNCGVIWEYPGAQCPASLLD